MQQSISRRESRPVSPPDAGDAPSPQELRQATGPFQSASRRRSLVQLATSFGPFLAACAAMYATLGISVWLTGALALLAAGFVVRIFIIQHDCGHGSFFRSRRANDITGMVCSLVTFAPYGHWRRQHAGHHANWNNLDHRGSGMDIYSTCLTVDEYRALSGRQQWLYRLSRRPLVSLLVFPPLVFLLLYRVPFDTPREWIRERWSVHATNAGLALVILALCVALGAGAVATVQLPVMVFASITGVWLFSVQHCFDAVKWWRKPEWNVVKASLAGSSFLRLPRVLQWFTGNIGYHHVHHLNSRIPNYRLQECHEALPIMAQVRTLSLGDALRAPLFILWDEARGAMVRAA